MTLDNSALIWVALAILAAIVEVSIPHFGVIFVSAGAIAAAIASLLGNDAIVQVVVFIAAMVISLAVFRRQVLRRLGGRGVPSRTDVLIGKEGLVTQDIDTRL